MWVTEIVANWRVAAPAKNGVEWARKNVFLREYVSFYYSFRHVSFSYLPSVTSLLEPYLLLLGMSPPGTSDPVADGECFCWHGAEIWKKSIHLVVFTEISPLVPLVLAPEPNIGPIMFGACLEPCTPFARDFYCMFSHLIRSLHFFCFQILFG